METTPMELRTHYRRMSTKQTDEAIAAVVEMVVNFLKKGESGTEETQKGTAMS